MKRVVRPRALSPADGDWATLRESLKDLYTAVNGLVDRTVISLPPPPTFITASASEVAVRLEEGVQSWSWHLAANVSTASTTDVYLTADLPGFGGNVEYSHFVFNGGAAPVESFSSAADAYRIARYDSNDDYVTAFGVLATTNDEARLIGVAHSDGVWQSFHGAAPGQARGALRFLGGFLPGTRLVVERSG